MPEGTPGCRAALGLLRGRRAAGAQEACGGALFDHGDNLQVRAHVQSCLLHRSKKGWVCDAGHNERSYNPY